MNLDTAEVREGEALDWSSLEDWLTTHVVGLRGDMQVSQFHGGHANLTYCVAFAEQNLVVRRQPFGEIAPGAHDMKREYRALSGLNPVFDRAPQVFAFCEDATVIGAPFIVMERRRGVVVRSSMPVEFRDMPNVEERLSFAVVDAMADLHRIEPEAAGLANLGRPDGFVSRQLAGWHQRWHRVRGEHLPEFDRVHQMLLDLQPESQRACIVHNDFKLDNCMFESTNPDRVQTVFDWDMATLGDPRVELGTLLSYWREPGDAVDRAPTIELDMSRFPSRDALVNRYARSGIDVADMAWFEAFALWKHAVVLQQLFARLDAGESTDERYRHFPDRIPGLIETAGRTLHGQTA